MLITVEEATRGEVGLIMTRTDVNGRGFGWCYRIAQPHFFGCSGVFVWHLSSLYLTEWDHPVVAQLQLHAVLPF